MDDDLVAVAAGAAVEAAGEGCFGGPAQGVGAALGWGYAVLGGGLALFLLVVEHVAPGLDGIDQRRARLGIQAAADDDHAVLVGPEVEVAAGVAEGLLLALFDPVDAAPGADQALDLGGGSRHGEVEELLLVVGGGYAAQGADFGVGDLAAAHGLGEARQLAQGAGDADVLAGRPEGQAGAPAEPMGAGPEAAIPALALVELADEGEELEGGGGDPGGELGDLFAEVFEVARVGGARAGREG